ncbi:hypothetical protein TNCV_335421 [Trichonephila clavipes]|nr:hypothetical protein TNCV_335421 [Trichonephila clavipes]
MEKVRKLISKDHRLTVLMIADELLINRESMRQIPIEFLELRKTWGDVEYDLSMHNKVHSLLFTKMPLYSSYRQTVPVRKGAGAN